MRVAVQVRCDAEAPVRFSQDDLLTSGSAMTRTHALSLALSLSAAQVFLSPSFLLLFKLKIISKNLYYFSNICYFQYLNDILDEMGEIFYAAAHDFEPKSKIKYTIQYFYIIILYIKKKCFIYLWYII